MTISQTYYFIAMCYRTVLIGFWSFKSNWIHTRERSTCHFTKWKNDWKVKLRKRNMLECQTFGWMLFGNVTAARLFVWELSSIIIVFRFGNISPSGSSCTLAMISESDFLLRIRWKIQFMLHYTSIIDINIDGGIVGNNGTERLPACVIKCIEMLAHWWRKQTQFCLQYKKITFLPGIRLSSRHPEGCKWEQYTKGLENEPCKYLNRNKLK